MKIVIDIDDEDFEEITEHYAYELGHDFSDEIFMKIENGTPLEKVLIDIKEKIEQERVGYPPSAGYYKAIIKCLQIIDKYKEEISVKQEPKSGKWIYDGDCIICSKCLNAFGWASINMASNFCPNCGADMTESEE